MAEEMREQRVMSSRPVIIQKAVVETETELASFGSLDWFSYFEVYNAGNGPAIEVEISLLSKERASIHHERKSFLQAGEPPIRVCPTELVDLEESTYNRVCGYRSILCRTLRPTWYQPWLPLEPVELIERGKL